MMMIGQNFMVPNNPIKVNEIMRIHLRKTKEAENGKEETVTMIDAKPVLENDKRKKTTRSHQKILKCKTNLSLEEELVPEVDYYLKVQLKQKLTGKR